MFGMKKHGGIALLILGLFFIISASAKDKKAKSVDVFYRLLASAPYSLVIFYDRSKQAMSQETIKENIKNMEIMLRSLSEDARYKSADLQMVRVDISRRDFADIIQQYAIKKVPTFMIFIGREPIGDQVTGFVFRSQLEELIDQHLKEKMDKHLQEKEEVRKRELEIARIRAYNRAYWWGPYWGPYWYGGYYPYWHGPYFGWW